MTALLDTSVILRYLTDEPPDLADIATAIIEEEDDLVIAPVGIAEVAWVLGSLYQQRREDIVDGLIRFVQRENVRVLGLEERLVIDALLLCRPSNRVSFADALIWAAARSQGDLPVYSFDRRFPSIQIEVRRAPV